jgi:hypothetical protein
MTDATIGKTSPLQNAIAPPDDLIETSKSDTEITVSWTLVSNTTSYMIHYKAADDADWIDSDDLGDVNTTSISNLAASTTY